MSLITIIGRGHSGTRAISNTLGASGVYMGEPLNKSWDLIPADEMYDACRIFAKYVDWVPGQNVSPNSLNNRSYEWSWKRALEADIPDSFIRRLRNFLKTVLESKAEHKGWKLPETTLCFPWITRLFPDAKYIFWIRNPRDCVIGSHVTDNLCNFGIPYDPVGSDRARRAISWYYQYKLVKATPHPKNWIEVRLEDFVLKQDETLARLEAFLGFPLVKIPVKPEVIGRWLKDEEDESTDPNFFPFFADAMREYDYDVPTSYKNTIHPFFTPNYDETQVPQYTLPDPLTFNDGRHVATKDDWKERRTELLDIMERKVFGKIPADTFDVSSELLESGVALGGKAIREQTRLTFTRKLAGISKSISCDLLVYRPANKTDPVPAFLGLNFHGNHCVTTENQILIPTAWNRNSEKYGIFNSHATEAGRGSQVEVWSVDTIINNGFALATAFYGDFDPDYDDCFRNGVHPLFQGTDWVRRQGDEWGAIGAWAWGMSRILDHISKQPWLNPAQVCAIGHSRLGKTALWAGATDERFAIACSIQSGCGGASLAHRCIGERIACIVRAFPHWFCPDYSQCADNEAHLDFDMHYLLALMAPRSVYVSSATNDVWADPKGEFLALSAADPVFRLLDRPGLGTSVMPPPDTPVGLSNGYHIRTGIHSVVPFDWEAYIAFAKRQYGL